MKKIICRFLYFAVSLVLLTGITQINVLANNNVIKEINGEWEIVIPNQYYPSAKTAVNDDYYIYDSTNGYKYISYLYEILNASCDSIQISIENYKNSKDEFEKAVQKSKNLFKLEMNINNLDFYYMYSTG